MSMEEIFTGALAERGFKIARRKGCQIICDKPLDKVCETLSEVFGEYKKFMDPEDQKSVEKVLQTCL